MAKRWGTYDPTEKELRREALIEETLAENERRETLALEERMGQMRESPLEQLELFKPSN